MTREELLLAYADKHVDCADLHKTYSQGVNLDLYEYYSPESYTKGSVVSHNCSACAANVTEVWKTAEEYMCEECYSMHLENLADAQDEEETMNDLTYWGIGV